MILKEIDAYVKEKIKKMSPSQLATLKALIFVGYKGERDYVLLELLKTKGENRIAESELTENFTSTFENETAKYYRIKPEFFRSVRKELFGNCEAV